MYLKSILRLLWTLLCLGRVLYGERLEVIEDDSSRHTRSGTQCRSLSDISRVESSVLVSEQVHILSDLISVSRVLHPTTRLGSA
jgi:hypothetical protein